jgi:cell division septum initiation protein DivIVA
VDPRGGGPLDIIFLVERLESLIANGKPLPLTRNAIVDRDAALNLIDELRVAVPEEVRAAKRINQEGERIIERAQEEADRIVGRAQEQAAYLIEERGLTEAAEDESRRIIAQAEEEGAQIRAGADDYAAGVLESLEAEVTRTLRGIERGLAMLDERRAAAAPPPEPAPAEAVDDGYGPEGAYDEDLDAEEGAPTVGRR